MIEKIENKSKGVCRKQDGDNHHRGSCIVCSSVAGLQEKWVVGHCCSVDDDNGDDPFLMAVKTYL